MIFKRSNPEPEPLTLSVGNQSYTFRTPSEFEFALAGRTCVPSAKVTALVDVRDDDLLNEAAAIKQAERRFADALSETLDDSERINDILKEVDLTLISHDNDWRVIISALMAVPAAFGRYKKIALVKYMQYLVSRQEIINGLYQHRQIHRSMDSALTEDPSKSPSNMKETAIFELSAFDPSGDDADFRRMAKGETIEIPVEKDEPVTVVIARHKCAIVMRDQLMFIDGAGREIPLREGQNVVGRDADVDISMEAVLRDISRKHLIIENDGSRVVRVTDISSHGTWLHYRYLDSTGSGS